MANNKYKPNFSIKSKNYVTPWLKNAMKSIGSSYGNSIKQLSPNLYDAVSSATSSSMNLYQGIRRNKNNINRIGESIKTNKYVSYMQTAYKNALTDLKTGNFDNQERFMKAMTEDISDSVEEATSGFSFGDDGADNVNINVINESSGLSSLQNQMASQAKSNIKMQKASMDAYIAVNAASMQQVGQLGVEVVGHLSNINSQLAALVQYNNDNMSKYIEASMAYFEKVGTKIEKLTDREDKVKLGATDLFKGSGGLDVSKYKEYIKQQFKGMINNSSLGIIKTLLDDDNMIKMAVSNPIRFLTNGLTSYAMPKILKTSIEMMEKAYNDAVPSLLEQIGDLVDDESSDIVGNLKRAIGNVFGVRNNRNVSFKDAKIEKGAISFDGETKHAITEVITKELRDQTGYLEIIANHYKKNAKKTVKRNGEYWDWNSNSYKKIGDTTNQLTDLMVKTIRDNMNSSKFGRALSGAVDTQNTKSSKAEVQKTIDELYVLMEKETKFLKFEDIISLVDKTNGNKNTIKLLKKWLQDMKSDSSNPFGNVSAAKLNTQTALKNLREEIKDNPTLYRLFDTEYADLEKDEIDTEFLRQLGLDKNSKRTNNQVRTRNVQYTSVNERSNVGNSYSEAGRSAFGQDITKIFTSALDRGTSIFKSIANGDTRGVISEGANLIAGLFTDLTSKINVKLFGTKNGSGYRENGIFSNVSNGLTDMVNKLKYKITGDEYTDSKGTKYKKNDDTVIGRFKQVGDVVKDSLMKKIFGKSKNDNGEYEKNGKGIVDNIGDSFKSAADSFKEFLFGSSSNDNDQQRNKGLLQNIRNSFNKGFYGNKNRKENGQADLNGDEILGKSIMGTAAGGLLGTLIGGPVVGSILGFSATFAKNADKFKKFFFGEEDGLTLADGTKTKKQGLFGVVNNYLSANIFAPLKNELSYIGEDIKTTIKHDILAPISFAAEYFSGKIGTFLGDVFNKVDGLPSFIGKTLRNIFPGATEAAGNLLTKGIDAAYNIGAKIVKAPGKLLVATVKALGIGDRIKAFFKPAGDLIKTGLKGIFKFTKHTIQDVLGIAKKPFTATKNVLKKGFSVIRDNYNQYKMGSFRSKISKYYNEYDEDLEYNDNLIKTVSNGEFETDSAEAREWLAENSPETLSLLKDSFSLRMKLNKREGQKAHLQNKIDRQFRKRIVNNGKLIAKWTKGQYKADSEEARSYLLATDPSKLKKLDNEAYDELKAKQAIVNGGTTGEAAQIAKGSLRGLSEEGKQTTLLAKIWDILFKSNNNGKSEEEVEKENEQIKNRPRDGQKRVIKKGKWGYEDQVYDAASGEWVKDTEKNKKDKYNQLPEDEKLHGSYLLKDFHDLGLAIKSIFTGTGRAHAKGGKLKQGLNIVGENGAELVNYDNGEVISSSDTAKLLNNIGEAQSDENRIARKNRINILANRANKSQQKELAAEKAAIAREEMDDLISDARRDVLSKAKDAATLAKEKSEEKFRNTVSTATEKIAEYSKNHLGLFSKIFSKKGLITGAVLAGLIFLKKNFPGIIKGIGSVLKGIGTGISWILNIFGNRKDNSYNENGKTGIQELTDVVEGATGIDANGDGENNFNPLQLNDDGSASRLTSKVARQSMRFNLEVGKGFLRKQAGKNAVTNANRIARHIPGFKTGSKINIAGNVLGGSLYDITNPLSKSATKETIASTATKNGKTYFYKVVNGKKQRISAEVAQDLAKKGANLVDDGAKLLVKESADDVAKAVTKKGTKLASEKGFRKTLSNAFKKFGEFILSKFKNKGIEKILKPILEKGAKAINSAPAKWIIEKCTKQATKSTLQTTAAGASAGLSEVAFMTLGALNSISGTAQLFKCKKEDVDGLMKTIAAGIGACQWSSIGGWVDIAFELISMCTNTDIVGEIAIALYNFYVGGEDSEKAQKLVESRAAFSTEYEEYREKTIKEQYKAQKAAGLTTAKNEEEFYNQVINDEASALYKSVYDYTTEKNGSVLDKGISATFKGIKKAGLSISKGTHKIFGGEVTYTDLNGNTYTRNSDGTYEVIDRNGNDLGYISKDKIPEDAKENKSKSIFSTSDNTNKTTIAPINNKKLDSIVYNKNEYLNKLQKEKRSTKDDLKTMTRESFVNMSEEGKQTILLAKIWDKINTENNGKENNGGRGSYNGSTYYSQNDPRWSNTSYNMGYDNAKMGDSGCGPVAAAMAFSDITGKNISPLQMANLSKLTGNRDHTGTNWNFINDASNLIGVDSTQVLNPNAYVLNKQLDSGNPVILSGTSGGYGIDPYTSNGHYVVAVGKDTNGNVLINDPRGIGYSGKYNINDIASHTGSSWSFGGRGRRRRGGRGPEVNGQISSLSGNNDLANQGYSSSYTRTTANLSDRGYYNSTDNYNKQKDWLSIVKACKKAIAEQKLGYSQSDNITITVNGQQITTRRDCSGFVSACLTLYTGNKILTNSSSFVSNAGIANYLMNAGFSKLNWTGWNDVRAGDILAKNGHVEIAAENGKNKVYNCGSHSSCNNPGVTNSGRNNVYNCIWRPNKPGTGGLDYTTNGAATGEYGNASIESGGTTPTSTETTSNGGGIWSRLTSFIGDFFTSFADKAMTGLSTGNWNSDYSDVTSATTTTTGTNNTVNSTVPNSYAAENGYPSSTDGMTNSSVTYSTVPDYSEGAVIKKMDSNIILNSDIKQLPHLSENAVRTIIKKRLDGKDSVVTEADAPAIVQAQTNSGISDLVLLGIAAQESGLGTSNIAKTKNNLWGWNATNKNPTKNAKLWPTVGDAFIGYANDLDRLYYNKRNERSLLDISGHGGGAKIGYAFHHENGQLVPTKEWGTHISDIISGFTGYGLTAKGNSNAGSKNATEKGLPSSLDGQMGTNPTLLPNEFTGETSSGGFGTGISNKKYYKNSPKAKPKINTGGFGIGTSGFNTLSNLTNPNIQINMPPIKTGNDNVDRLINEVISVLQTIANNTGDSSNKLNMLSNLSGKGNNIIMSADSSGETTRSILSSNKKGRMTAADIKNNEIVKGGY